MKAMTLVTLVRRVLPVLLLGVSGASAAPSSTAPPTEDECRAIWNVAAGRSDLSFDGAKPYIDDFERVDINRDRKISNAEFKAGCAAGLVHPFRKED